MTVEAGLPVQALAMRLGGHEGAIENLVRLSGGASQETWRFELVTAHMRQALILRRAPGGHDLSAEPVAIGLAGEARLLRAIVPHGVAAPRVVHVLEAPDGLGTGYVMECVEGETLPRRLQRDAAFAGARERFAADCGAALARVHAVALAPGVLPGQSDGAGAQLVRYEQIFRSFDSARPAFEIAFRQLKQTLPAAAPPTLVHGDFRLGNLMLDATGLKCLLDWELAHLGDPVEDLAWLCVPSWRFGQTARPVGGIGALGDLLDAYERAGGRPVDRARFDWWLVFGTLKWGIMCLMMYRAFEQGLDRSVERAAIGRRTSETELDLMLLLEGRL